GFEIAMKTLAEKAAAATGYKGALRWDPSRPNGQPRRMLDVSRAKERFGFSSTTSLDAGLAKTIAWYRGNRRALLDREAAKTTSP
ncbi:MAG: GDP-L-fucose synthase, partial [Byssovorax sp.]